jgi:hypothetical protein
MEFVRIFTEAKNVPGKTNETYIAELCKTVHRDFPDELYVIEPLQRPKSSK